MVLYSFLCQTLDWNVIQSDERVITIWSCYSLLNAPKGLYLHLKCQWDSGEKFTPQIHKSDQKIDFGTLNQGSRMDWITNFLTSFQILQQHITF